MKYDTLMLPVDKMHILRKMSDGWEYLVQENENYRKGYYLYPNEVDAETYNFEGYNGTVQGADSGVVVAIHSDDDRVSQSYDMKGRVIREDTLSMKLIYESLSRCQSPYITNVLHKKKATATFSRKLQSVELPLDDTHHLVQTMTGLWRYISDVSHRTYVFMRSEIDIHDHHAVVTPFERTARIYVNKEPDAIPMADVITYLITHENEMYFEDKASLMLNMSLIVNRRGWGTYIHMFDKDLNLHAFKLQDKDEVPEEIPHILDTAHMVDVKGMVTLYGDTYEDELVMANGEYVKQGVFYPAVRLARPKADSIFYNQDAIIRKYRHKDSRRVEISMRK